MLFYILECKDSVFFWIYLNSGVVFSEFDWLLTKKNKCIRNSDTFTLEMRSVPDSNGCGRFCRPLTKPLIQPTISHLRLQRYMFFLYLQNFFCRKVPSDE